MTPFEWIISLTLALFFLIALLRADHPYAEHDVWAQPVGPVVPLVIE